MPDPGQQDGFFPVRLPQESAQTLRRLLEEQSAELRARNRDLQALTDNIPGGVLQCQNDDCFTISHMSDGFLSLCCLLYTSPPSRSPPP